MLLYYVVALKDLFQKDVFDHIMCLHVAIYILSSCLHENEKLRSYANELLKYFVDTFPDIYGKHRVSSNVHGLTHLVDDVKRYGCLDSFAAWKFENFMRIIKGFIRKGDRPLQQLYLRYDERTKHYNIVNRKLEQCCTLIPAQYSKHKKGPLTLNCYDPQYNVAKNDFFTLNCKKFGHTCFGTKCSEIISVKNIAFNKELNDFVAIGQKFTARTESYLKPCKSSELGIYKVKQLSSLKMWPLSELIVKYYIMPYSEESYIVVPLIHNL